METKNIKELKITDENYPKLLKEIHDPPKLLYWRGDLDALNSPISIAVVGTRRCSQYGKEATHNIVAELAKAGVAIISGMARGIDTYAHEAALEYNTTTIAVLGSAIDDKSIYPKNNVKLAYKIIESGGIILSEYEPGAPALRHQFPERNRIVAGLAQGTLIVEAPFKSGAMITARLAVEENRDVYAVPGSIFSRLSEGCNDLIARGAKCTRSAKDILEEYNINYQIAFENKADTLDGNEALIFKLITEAPEAIHIDKIIQNTKLDASDVSQIVSKLMLEDFIKEAEANCYIANRQLTTDY